MTGPRQLVRRSLCVGVSAMAILAAGCATAPKGPTALNGSQEVPPVTTNASGTTDISVLHMKCPSAASGSQCPTVFGSVVTSGVAATAVHIHMAAPGENGPPIVTLLKVSETMWTVPTPTTITEDQWKAWFVGNLYVNVHSDANKGGEIRGQLKR